MKIRFHIDQAHLFRKGIDAPKSIVTLEVDPSKCSQEDRNLIADRLSGIDLFKLATKGGDGPIVALGIDYSDMIKAIQEDQKQMEIETGNK